MTTAWWLDLHKGGHMEFSLSFGNYPLWIICKNQNPPLSFSVGVLSPASDTLTLPDPKHI